MDLLKVTFMALACVFVSCNPCKTAARKVDRAKIICPEIVKRDSQFVAYEIPEIRHTYVFERDSAEVYLMATNLIAELNNEPARAPEIITEFIYENCLEEDTVKLEFEGNGYAKIWIQDGKVHGDYFSPEKTGGRYVHTETINPTVENKKSAIMAWIVAFFAAVLLLLLVWNKGGN